MKKYIIFLFLLITTISLKTFTIDELILKTYTNKFNEALKVYLIDHEVDVDEIVSLNTLKEEGLINGNLNINYDINYYRVSKLSDSELKCESGMNFSAVTNWLNNKDKSNEIYFCKKETEEEEPEGDVFDPYKLCGEDSDKLFCEVITNAMEQEDKFKETYFTQLSVDASDKTKLLFADDIYTVYRDYVKYENSHFTRIFEKANYNNMELREVVLKEYYEKPSGDAYFEAIKGSDRFPYYQYSDTYEITSERKLQATGKSWNNFNKATWKNPNNKSFFDLTISELKELEGKYISFMRYSGGSKNTILIKLISVDQYDATKTELTYKYYYFVNKEINYEKTLAKTEDEYGYSYYFKGDIKDNYVNFNNMCWRMVRVQGDGSIKLVLESHLEKCNEDMVNFQDDNFYTHIIRRSYLIGEGYYGYLYGGKKSLLVSYNFPTYQRDESMQSYLIKWFNENIDINNIKFLKQQRFCMGNILEDKNYGTTVFEYAADGYSVGKKESLKCPTSDKIKTLPNYISALTADEIAFAGGGQHSTTGKADSYLETKVREWSDYHTCSGTSNCSNTEYNFFTLTTSDASSTTQNIYYFDGDWDEISRYSIHKYDDTYDAFIHAKSGFRPVIVLNRNVLFKSGRGTIDNPYEVKL